MFPTGEFKPDDATVGRPYDDLRWNRFKNFSAQDMYEVVDRYVFPFMQARAADTTHAAHMKGARLTIPTPALLQKQSTGSPANSPLAEPLNPGRP